MTNIDSVDDRRQDTRQSEGSDARRPGLDALRTVAMLGVVVIHVSALRMKQSPSLVAHAMNVTMAWAVPVFMTASGYLHARSIVRNGRYQAARKRLTRLGALFAVWSIIYLMVENGPSLGFPMNASRFMGIVVLGQASYHLWFLPALMGATLTSSWADTKQRRRINVAIGLTLFASALLGTLLSAPLPVAPLADLLKIPALRLINRSAIKWLLPYAIGMTLADSQRGAIDSARWRWPSLALCGAMLLAPVLSSVSGVPIPQPALFWGTLAASLFSGYLLTRSAVFGEQAAVSASIATAWPYALGVYLIHPLLLPYIAKIPGQGFPNAVWIPLTTAILVAVSIGAVALLRRIPLIGWLAGD